MKSIKILAVLSWLGASACGSSEPEPTPEPVLPAEPLESEQGQGNVLAPSIAFGANGALAVAWAESKDLSVRRWMNSHWETLGGPLSAFAGDTPAFWSSVQVDAQGNPVVAWQERVPNELIRNSIIVRRWDAGRWVSLGTPLNIGPDTNDASKPSLQLDAEGNPLVAWSEKSGGDAQIAVRRWNASAWQALGAATVAPGSVWSLTLAANAPVLVSQRRTFDAEGEHLTLEVRRWTGSTWENLGSPLGVRAIAPQVRADAAGHLFLAWLDEGQYPDPARLRLLQWSGTAWEPLGTDVTVSQGDSRPGAPELVIDAEGRPLVAWLHAGVTQSLRVARWTGQDWSVKVVEDSTRPGSSDGWCALAFHPVEGAVVAWTPGTQAPLRVLRIP